MEEECEVRDFLCAERGGFGFFMYLPRESNHIVPCRLHHITYISWSDAHTSLVCEMLD